MSLFATPNVAVTSNQTGSVSISATNDLTPFLITAAATATLPLTGTAGYSGLVLAGRAGGQGISYIQNLAASTANVTIAPASGDAIFGNSIVSPGQIVKCESDGQGTWYCSLYGTTVGAGQILSVAVPLTSANILAMNATPVSLIAAPGAGKALRVMDVGFEFTAATQYANGGAVELRYTNGSGTKVTADIAAAVITSASSSWTNVGGIEASLTLTENAALIVTNATAAFITGTGTGLFSIVYRVVG